MRQSRLMARLASQGAKTSPWEQGPDFALVGTSQTVVVHATLGIACTVCCQVLLLRGVYQFKSPLHSQI
jgi:hypothetical protein